MIDEKRLIAELDKDRTAFRSELYADDSIRKYFIGLIDEQPKINDWIPVSERLPDTPDYVLVTLGYTYEADYTIYSTARYIDFGNGEAHWHDNKHGYLEWEKYSDGRGGSSSYKVVAWMPLPKPYKGDNNE